MASRMDIVNGGRWGCPGIPLLKIENSSKERRLTPTNGTHPRSTPLMLDDEHPLEGPWHTPGYLMIIGGADRLDAEGRLAHLFLQLAARAEANTPLRDIVLISTA